MNRKFGDLVIIAKHHRDKFGKWQWECKCKCGNITYGTLFQIRSGHKKSCGCLRKIWGRKHRNFRGVGDISHSHFTEINISAIKRGISFNLSLYDMWNLYKKQQGRCALSGIPLSLEGSVNQNRHKNTSLRTASLDRIDSNRGYNPNNVQWVSKDINMMKQQLSQQQFIKICKQVTKYNKL